MKYLIIFLLCLSFFCSACRSEDKYSITRAPIITDDYRYSVIDVAYANEKIGSSILDKKYGDVQIFIIPKTLYYDVVILRFEDGSKISQDLIKQIREDAIQFLNESRRERLKNEADKTPEAVGRAKGSGFSFCSDADGNAQRTRLNAVARRR